MRTNTRIALGITTVAIALAPVTAAFADDGTFQFPITDEGTTLITIAPITTVPDGDTIDPFPVIDPILVPDDDPQIDPSVLGEVDLDVLSPDEGDDGLQIDPSVLGEVDLDVLGPDDDGLVQVAPSDPQMPDWFKQALEQAVADALAAQGTTGPTDVTVEVVAPAGDGDSAQVDAAEAVAATENPNPWPYALGGAAAAVAVWAMLGIGARMASRRS